MHFAPELVCDSKDCAFDDCTVVGAYFFEGRGREAVPRDVDDVIGARDDVEVSVLILVARITSRIIPSVMRHGRIVYVIDGRCRSDQSESYGSCRHGGQRVKTGGCTYHTDIETKTQTP